MTLAEFTELVRDWTDELKIPQRVLLYLINRVEYEIQTQLLLRTEGIVQYEAEDFENGTELMFGDDEPDVYLFYVTSMLYFRRGEYEEYENQMAMFNSLWEQFERRLALTAHGGTSERNPYEGGS